jgi:hypothetical protein
VIKSGFQSYIIFSALECEENKLSGSRTARSFDQKAGS